MRERGGELAARLLWSGRKEEVGGILWDVCVVRHGGEGRTQSSKETGLSIMVWPRPVFVCGGSLHPRPSARAGLCCLLRASTSQHARPAHVLRMSGKTGLSSGAEGGAERERRQLGIQQKA